MKRFVTALLFLGLLASVVATPALVAHASGSPGTWSLTGSMNFARYEHTAILLQSGEVLVWGGKGYLNGSSGVANLNTAELYDPTTGSWSLTGSTLSAHIDGTATLLQNGEVLVAGGVNGDGTETTITELYDPTTGTWSLTGSMTTVREYATATLLQNGEVLVAGGGNSESSDPLNSAELYNPVTGLWTATGSMSDGRENHTATLLSNGEVLVAGGTGAENYLASAELYDPATGLWASTGAMTTFRVYHTATLLSNGEVLVAGGFGNTGYQASAELYDPTTGTWSLTGSMSDSREYHTATLLPNGEVLVTGGKGIPSGDNVAVVLTTAELYDPTTGTWSYTGTMNDSREYHTATLLQNGQVLVAGGYQCDCDNAAEASAELYSPVITTMPVVSAPPNATVNQGDTYSATGSFTDPGATSWTATVDYGDGAGPQPLALSGMTFALSHVYTSPGVYSVDVMVTDNFGASGSATWTVTVNAPPAFTSGSTASTGMRVPFSFTVTTTGSPTPSLSEAGALPTGITFVDNGDGTGTLAGEAAAGTNGTYNLTLSASNGVGAPATQAFTLSITTATSAPAITSSSSDTETFQVPFSFTVTTDGFPVPTLSKTGTLPAGVTFVDNGDGTATLSGTPGGTAAGVYSLTLKAKNAVATVTQSFTLTIVKTPVFKAVTIPVGHVGSPYTLTLKTSAYTTAALTESGALPAGLTFVDNGDGTATIAGTPQPGSGGAYPVVVTATNAQGSSTKSFTIKVDEAPTITSDASASATVGQAFSFVVTATGYPAPSITKSGTLPKGVTYHSATGTLSGTPAAGSQGTYTIIFTAKNSSGSVQQTFTLTVQAP